VHIELKHTALFERLGLPLHEPLVDLLRSRGLTSPLSPASVMSFDSRALKRVRREIDVPLVRLLDRDEPVRRGRLQRIGTYASAVGLHKHHALPPAPGHGASRPGTAVAKAFDAGLDVLVWTLRNENRHLPQELRRPGRPRVHGDAATEVARLFDLGVDGVLTDFPETAVEVRENRTAAALLA
jgi:glycerophosphoryl diester phosphodiesterase